MRNNWENVWRNKRKKKTIHFKQFEKMKELMGNLEGRRVLEVGCGSGIDSFNLCRYYGTENYCLDFSENSMRIVKRMFASAGLEARMTLADIENIPYPDNFFDIVFSNGVMEHFKNLSNPLKEQKRILTYEGLLVMGVPYKYTLHEIERKIKTAFGKWEYGWERGFTMRHLEREINSVGMKTISSYFDAHPISYLPDSFNGTWVNFIMNGGFVIFSKKMY